MRRRLPRKPDFVLFAIGVVLAFQFFLAGQAAWGQASPASTQGIIEMQMKDVNANSCDKLRRFVVTVTNEDRLALSRQAVVRLHDLTRDITTWQTTTTPESQAMFCSIDYGDYDVETSAVGYTTDHQQYHLDRLIQGREIKVILRKDPIAFELDAPDQSVPLQARRDTKRAIAALTSGKFKEAKKRLDSAYKIAPSSAQVNFLYGYLYVQTGEIERSEDFLKRAVTFDPHRAHALTLLGRVELQRQQYDDARKTLEQAVLADQQYWMAHYLLGDAYLRSKEYEKAAAQAQAALDDGKAGAAVANLVLGQALANLGHNPEALQVLKTFIATNSGNAAVPKVEDLMVRLEKRALNEGEIAIAEPANDLALTASAPSLPESAWGPPGVDDVKPPVAPGVTCPAQQVIDGASERVKQLVDNIAKFAAVEDLVHEQLDKTGNATSKETRKFDYVASVTENPPGFLETDEYRNLRYGITDLPDHIVTSGFVTLALVFHPAMRDNFEMTCEGLGDWHGQSAWLVHFRQRDDKPSRFEDYTVGTQRYPMKLKGRAWITTDELQIVRIESDLVAPLPQLSVQHQIAEYGRVPFQKKNIDLWLPQSVDIFLELNKHRYHRRHSFDHYMLFSVNSEDKSPALNQAAPRSVTRMP